MIIFYKRGSSTVLSLLSSHLSSFLFRFPFFLFDETRLDHEIGNTTMTNMHASFLDHFIQANEHTPMNPMCELITVNLAHFAAGEG